MSNDRFRSASDLALKLISAAAECASKLRGLEKSNDSSLAPENVESLTKSVLRIHDIATDLLRLTDSIDQVQRDVSAPTDETQNAEIPVSASQRHCAVCGKAIPSARIQAMPDVMTCVKCAEQQETSKPAPATRVSESDISRYRKRLAQQLEDEKLKARARRSTSKPRKRRRRKKKKAP